MTPEHLHERSIVQHQVFTVRTMNSNARRLAGVRPDQCLIEVVEKELDTCSSWIHLARDRIDCALYALHNTTASMRAVVCTRLDPAQMLHHKRRWDDRAWHWRRDIAIDHRTTHSPAAARHPVLGHSLSLPSDYHRTLPFEVSTICFQSYLLAIVRSISSPRCFRPNDHRPAKRLYSSWHLTRALTGAFLSPFLFYLIFLTQSSKLRVLLEFSIRYLLDSNQILCRLFAKWSLWL